jgi:hypothetical protein
MKFLSYQDGWSPLCPSYLESNKTCKHIASCPEAGWAAAFRQSTNKIKKWMENNGTHPDVKLQLLRYLRGRGLTTCLEYAGSLNLPPILCKYATSQDVIGWDNFVMGMIPRTLLAIHNRQVFSRYAVDCGLNHPPASNNAHAMDIQMCASSRSQHRSPDIGPQGRAP